MRFPSLRVLAALAAAFIPARSTAQVHASERATVSQVVDGTTIALDYSRPLARGRKLFGGLVPWARPWTPGANWATTIETDRDIRLNGHLVPKGKYSIWTIPNPDEWTVIVSRQARAFHTRPPADSTAQARFAVKPDSAGHMEAMAWYFPVVARAGATLRLHWGTTVIPLQITVQPTRPLQLTPAERAAYVGSYRMPATPGGLRGSRTLEVFDDGKRLRARTSPGLFGNDEELDLVPEGAHRFSPGWYRSGAFFDVETDMIFAFTVEGGRATAVEFRGLAENIVFARGERVR